MEGSALSAPALGPVGLQFCGFLGIFQGVCVVLLGSVGGSSVAVEDVVLGCQSDGLGEFLTVTTALVRRTLRRSVDMRVTYTASSKFFSAMALLPRALSSSAVDIVECGNFVRVSKELSGLKLA